MVEISERVKVAAGLRDQPEPEAEDTFTEADDAPIDL
jgi:hypothetical protein